MAGEEIDPLKGSIAVEGSVSWKGVPVGALAVRAQSRMVVALDRLVGSAIEFCNLFDARNRYRRQTMLHREGLADIENTALANALAAIPELGIKGAEHFVRESARKKFARENVAAAALNQLTNENVAEDKTAVSDDEGQIDSDWLNLFSQYAEQASSDRLQELWGLILAGEIRKPGSFSPRTMRIVAELDRSTAVKFQNVLNEIVEQKYIASKQVLQGDEVEDLIDLDDAGLVKFSSLEIKYPADGGRCQIRSENHVAIIEISDSPTLAVKGWNLSRAGRELASILPRPTGQSGLHRLLETMRPMPKSVEILRILGTNAYGGLDTVIVERINLPLSSVR